MIRTLVTDSTDFCGEKEVKFIIKNLTTTSIKAKNSDFIHFSPFSNSVEFGLEQAQMIAYLNERLWVSAFIGLNPKPIAGVE